MPLSASLTFRDTTSATVGRERMRLLAAVARTGSISAGAREVGLSYKAAWDALDAMANLFGLPLLAARTGGRSGGGASLTPAGLRVLTLFDALEGDLARVLRQYEPDLADLNLTPHSLFSGFYMRTSARNALRGTITRITADAVSAEVTIRIGGDAEIRALVTARSISDLTLCEGRSVVALIKANFVMIAPGDTPPSLSVGNCLPGHVQRTELGAVTAEVVVALTEATTLAATISAASARMLNLAPGQQVMALFDAAHVILATD